MANTLTNLTPDLYAALDVVSRELVGLIPSVSRDSSLERAALNQTVRSFVAPASTAASITPGQLPPNTGDQTLTNKTITISKAYQVPVRWKGEEQLGMNTGPGYNNILRDQFAQAMRVLCNTIEADLASLYFKASNAAGPAGTTLFDAANYKDVANVAKLLDDNGAPLSDRHLILNNSAAAAFRGNAQYYSYLNAGNIEFLRQGELMDIHNIRMRASGQIKTVAVGTASGLKTDSTGYAVGATAITVDVDGSGTIVAGDVITISNDPSGAAYVVLTGGTMDSGGTVTIGAPGLKGVIPAAQGDIVVNASTQKNMAFSRDAIHLVTRAPAVPAEGDSAIDSMVIQDPRSGLAFDVRMYKEYRQVHFEVAIAWGYEVIKPEHLVLLID